MMDTDATLLSIREMIREYHEQPTRLLCHKFREIADLVEPLIAHTDEGPKELHRASFMGITVLEDPTIPPGHYRWVYPSEKVRFGSGDNPTLLPQDEREGG